MTDDTNNDVEVFLNKYQEVLGTKLGLGEGDFGHSLQTEIKKTFRKIGMQLITEESIQENEKKVSQAFHYGHNMVVNAANEAFTETLAALNTTQEALFSAIQRQK